ncbi:Serine carboxypeptidase-like 49 [Trichinella nelsoni]|uniref:Serine carboxypeptidase-like 49 n=1 Tax=Trichinella nelsoni TaxID=6336 RepID=A0A0V0RBH7_9BILA|nr:Serine carboxypeptidase-like 49 [Trichinella nelsoni]
MAIKLCGTDGTVSCMASYFVCNTIFSSIIARAGNVNYYDIRKKCTWSWGHRFCVM